MWPWGSCSQLEPPWTPAKEGWYLIPKPPCIKMKLRLLWPSRRQRPTAAAIRETEATGGDHTHTLQQSLGESMQDLEHEAIEMEEWDHQSFLEACCPKAHGVLMYPLQLLIGNMSLATLLATTPNWPLQLGNLQPQLPSDHVRDTHTSNRDQMMTPFI